MAKPRKLGLCSERPRRPAAGCSEGSGSPRGNKGQSSVAFVSVEACASAQDATLALSLAFHRPARRSAEGMAACSCSGDRQSARQAQEPEAVPPRRSTRASSLVSRPGRSRWLGWGWETRKWSCGWSRHRLHPRPRRRDGPARGTTIVALEVDPRSQSHPRAPPSRRS